MPSSKKWSLGFALGFVLIAPGAFADQKPLPVEARKVIESQLDAIAHDDADAAYRLTSPALREKFADASSFLSMVKSNYAPVYKHRSLEFGATARDGDQVGQSITIVDDDNEVWTVIYLLGLQPDGSWRTTGCVLSKSPQSSI